MTASLRYTKHRGGMGLIPKLAGPWPLASSRTNACSSSRTVSGPDCSPPPAIAPSPQRARRSEIGPLGAPAKCAERRRGATAEFDP